MDFAEILQEIEHEVQPLLAGGRLPSYIPPLAEVPLGTFGMALKTIDGEVFSTGAARTPFSIQSISKLFTLTLAFRHEGAALWERIGQEPSGTPFNSLVQLEYERGVPRNPFINAGALVVADMILSHEKNPRSAFLTFMRKLSGSRTLAYDEEVHRAETESGHRNRSLAHLLKDFGNLHHPVEKVLKFYFSQCSLTASCEELASAALFLANEGVSPTCGPVVDRRQAKRINAVMLTCGTYDAAGDFVYRVGLPGKSGVGGGIVATVPGRMSLCVWSPGLNPAGNSYAGTKALELVTTKTRLSIF